ncbi:hypothetical protein C0Q70_15731 [Pomacea canaliculata]|uniref:Uncharacterized protein n=1 Tax=Pomacea canaliculata TaxID=400727 RepID=A0A2T7NVN9_POMCA|nr:hypothetical protein C0Q70_15731 [Pomacea canaliculata]
MSKQLHDGLISGIKLKGTELSAGVTRTCQGHPQDAQLDAAQQLQPAGDETDEDLDDDEEGEKKKEDEEKNVRRKGTVPNDL